MLVSGLMTIWWLELFSKEMNGPLVTMTCIFIQKSRVGWLVSDIFCQLSFHSLSLNFFKGLSFFVGVDLIALKKTSPVTVVGGLHEQITMLPLKLDWICSFSSLFSRNVHCWYQKENTRHLCNFHYTFFPLSQKQGNSVYFRLEWPRLPAFKTLVNVTLLRSTYLY